MAVVRDPAGREWIVEEHALGGDAVSHRPGNRLPEPTYSMLRVKFGNEQFFATVKRDWRNLSNEELWKLLARARQEQERG